MQPTQTQQVLSSKINIKLEVS